MKFGTPYKIPASDNDVEAFYRRLEELLASGVPVQIQRREVYGGGSAGPGDEVVVLAWPEDSWEEPNFPGAWLNPKHTDVCEVLGGVIKKDHGRRGPETIYFLKGQDEAAAFEVPIDLDSEEGPRLSQRRSTE